MFNFLRRPQQVKESLTKTRQSFLSKLTTLVAKNELNEDFWVGLEETLIGADVATIPYSVIMQLAKHPLTDAGIKKFLEDWEKVPK